MRSFLVFVFIFCNIAQTPISAQEQFIEGFKKLIHIGPFYDEGAVAGYFCLFEMDKVGNGKNVYRLDLFDSNLSVIASEPFIDEKNISLIQGVSTGNSLLLLSANPQSDTYSYRIFDYQGEQLVHETFARVSPLNRFNPRPITGLNSKGFLHYMATPSLCTIKLIPDKPAGPKGWEIKKKIGSPLFRMEYLASDKSMLLSSLATFHDESASYFIVGTDLDTGEEIFETEINDSRYAIRVTNSWFTSEEISLFGFYFEKTENIFSGKSLGICAFEIDKEGHIVSRKFLSWSEDVSGFLPSNEKGKVEGIGYLFFHDFVIMRDGTVFGIAENYRKTASALGIAASIINPTSMAGLTKMTIEDLYVFEFTPGFDLRSVRIFEKQKNGIELDSGSDFESAQSVANKIKETGQFDYEFTQLSESHTEFISCYQGLYRDIGVIRYNGKEMDCFKPDLAALKGSVTVLPGKAGYILVCQHRPSKDELFLRLERLDEEKQAK